MTISKELRERHIAEARERIYASADANGVPDPEVVESELRTVWSCVYFSNVAADRLRAQVADTEVTGFVGGEVDTVDDAV